MIPNPIHKVLSVMRTCRVRSLLMGGQACVLYGGSEFSRDTDLAVMADADNIAAIGNAMAELRGEVIAVPPFEARYLERGHAVHFRCTAPDVEGMRVDIMSVMRGVAPFTELWKRRSTIELADTAIEVLSLQDLVKAKKTQRDKDWPMIRRLIEADYEQRHEGADSATVLFWLRECRTIGLLHNLCRQYPQLAHEAALERPLLELIGSSDDARAEEALLQEETRERRADRAYWEPLRRELEQLRKAEHRTRNSVSRFPQNQPESYHD